VLALSLAVAGSGAVLADTVTTPGDFIPSYNVDTSTPSGTAPDVGALQSQIDSIMNDTGLDQAQKEAAVQQAITDAGVGGPFGSCAEQLDPLLLGLDSASVATELE
jgi:hypothetical protein